MAGHVVSTGRFAVPDGPVVAFDDHAGGDPALVFSHGLFMDGSMFRAQVADLGHDHRCITWDERLHGATEWEGGPFTFWDSAGDLLSLLDHLRVDRAVLIGMSQGFMVTARAALLAPERVRGLVMIDSQLGLLPAERAEGFRHLTARWAVEGPDEETLQSIAEGILGPGVDGEPWKAKWRKYPWMHPQLMIEPLVRRDDLRPRLGELVAPLLVLHGSADVYASIDRAEEVARGVPDLRKLVVIDGAGHAANMSHADVVNAEIREFVAGL